MSPSNDDPFAAPSSEGPRLDPTLAQLEKAPDVDPRGGLGELAGKTVRYVGDYEIIDEIARGGMGAVLLGRDTKLGRELAIKVLLDSHVDDQGLTERFVEEAQISGQLQHPGIAPVYEMGRFDDQRPFFSMKLVKGRTLATLLAERATAAGEIGSAPTIVPHAAAQIEDRAGGEHDRDATAAESNRTGSDVPRFLSIFEQICQTLGYAHARGVIHRDIKPSNIMVGAFGEVQVMDWGLAKVMHRDGASRKHADLGVVRTARHEGSTAVGISSSETRAGSILGTPAYMAPEQARGELDLVDERADVFGLGAILLELLTGKPPYIGSSVDACIQAAEGRLEEALTRLDASAADPELIALTRRCLAANRDNRPRDAGEVAAAITGYLAGVQQRLRQAELARAEAQARAAEERKRRRVEVGLALTVLALATVGGLTAFRVVQGRRELANRVELALAEGSSKRDQARTGQGNLLLWTEAVESARRAEAVLAGGGTPALTQRVQALVDEVEGEASDARLDGEVLEALIDARVSRLDRGLVGTDAAYQNAFRRYGFDVDEMRPEDAINKLSRRPPGVAEQLSAAIDDWATLRNDPQLSREGSLHLWAIAAGLDLNPFRADIRTAMTQADVARLRELAEAQPASSLPAASAALLARLLASRGDIASAAALLRKAQERHPDDLWVNFELAGYLKKLSPPQNEEALRFYTTARALHPTVAHELAHFLADIGRGQEAREVFLDLERRAPDEPSHPTCCGGLLRELGGQDEAVSAFDRAIAAGQRRIQQNAKDAVAHYMLATALRGNQRLDEALVHFQDASRLRPDFAEALAASGVVLSQLNRRGEAEAVYRKALQLYPDLATARTNLATLLQEQGRLGEAISEFREAIRRDPSRALLHYNLGNALAQAGEPASAVASYKEALRWRDDMIQARVNLGVSQARAGDLDVALATLRDAVARRPDFENAWNNLARALFQSSRIEELAAAAQKKPDLPKVQYFLAAALYQQGRYAEAVAPLRESLRLVPDDVGTLLMLGVCTSQLGQQDEAIGYLQRAVELRPNDASGRFQLAGVLMLADRRQEAITSLREAVRLDPRPESLCNLGHALRDDGAFEEALDFMRRGHEQGVEQQGWSYPSAAWVAECERLVKLERELAATSRGEFVPRDAEARIALAQIAHTKRLYASAAHLMRDALASSPALADDLAAGHRYQAACLAALAASGKGADGETLDPAEKARWRRQAIDWLRADLAAWKEQSSTGGPDVREKVERALHHWQLDSDLAGVRDDAELASLTDGEKAECWQLWSDVAALLSSTSAR